MSGLTLKDKLTVLDIENYNGVIKIDLREMMGLNNESEEAFIKVDEISKMFGKKVDDFLRRKEAVELISAICKHKSYMGNCPTNYMESSNKDNSGRALRSEQYEKEKSNYWLDDVRYNRQYHVSKLLYKLDGRAKSMLTEVKGTYVHSDLMIDYMKWLSPELSVLLNMKFKELVKNIHVLKENRRASISEFHKLIAVTSKYYPPKQQSGYAGEYADSKLMDLINMCVVGSKASKFREANDIPPNEPTRKYFTEYQLEKVERCEAIVCGLIEYGGLDNYKDIKEELKKRLSSIYPRKEI